MIEFDKNLEKAERHFGILEGEKRDDYFKFFRYLSEDFFKGVVDEVIKSHRAKGFPMVAEFQEAIEILEKSRNYASIEDLQEREKNPCPKCQNDGMIIEERFYLGVVGPIAVFCDCEIGEKRKRAIQKKLKFERQK